MSDPVVISMIGAGATVLISIINAAFLFMGHGRGKRNEKNISDLKEQTNGIQEKLVKVTGEAEYAKGVKSEVDREK
jgi:hypothetical protein